MKVSWVSKVGGGRRPGCKAPQRARLRQAALGGDLQAGTDAGSITELWLKDTLLPSLLWVWRMREVGRRQGGAQRRASGHAASAFEAGGASLLHKSFTLSPCFLLRCPRPHASQLRPPTMSLLLGAPESVQDLVAQALAPADRRGARCAAREARSPARRRQPPPPCRRRALGQTCRTLRRASLRWFAGVKVAMDVGKSGHDWESLARWLEAHNGEWREAWPRVPCPVIWVEPRGY